MVFLKPFLGRLLEGKPRGEVPVCFLEFENRSTGVGFGSRIAIYGIDGGSSGVNIFYKYVNYDNDAEGSRTSEWSVKNHSWTVLDILRIKVGSQPFKVVSLPLIQVRE